jgi:uncharacterized membrane protein
MTSAPAPEAGDPLDEPTATGLPPRVAATLAYAAWWVSGALFLVIEPTHPFVRFHARQAFLGLGAIWLAGCVLWAASFAAVFVSMVAFQTSLILAQAAWASGVVLWIVCLVRAWRGQWRAIPGLGATSRRSSPRAPGSPSGTPPDAISPRPRAR